MANGVNRRNGNGNGDWEGEWTPDEGWWPGTSTEAGTIPPVTPVVPPVNDWTVGHDTPGASVPFEAPEPPPPVAPPALAPFPQAPPGLTEIPGTSGPLEVPGISMPAQPPALAPFPPPALPRHLPGLTETTEGFQPAPQEFLEEGEFPIEEEAADPFAQFKAQMKTPEYRERMAEQQRNRNYIGGWRGGRGNVGPIQEGSQYLNNPNWTWEEDVPSGPLYGGEIEEKSDLVVDTFGMDPSTAAWAQQTPTDPSFQEWLGRGAPTGRAWGGDTEQSLGNLNWNPASGTWEDLQYQPWQYTGGREGPSPFVGGGVGDYPTAGGEDLPLRDLGMLAGGTGIYAPGGELGPQVGEEHRGDIRRLWDEFQETPFGGGGIVGFPGRAENLSAFEQDYNRRVAEMQAGQETQRGRYGDIKTAMGQAQYTDPYTGEITDHPDFGGTPTVNPTTGIVDDWNATDWLEAQAEGAETAEQQKLDAAEQQRLADEEAARLEAERLAKEAKEAKGVSASDAAATAQAAKDAEQARLDKERADRETDAEAKRLSDEAAAAKGRAGADVPDLPDVDTTTEGVDTVLDQVDPAKGVTPWRPPEYEATATIPIGMSPLDQLADADLATLLQTGGVAPTPLAGETERTLTDILQGRGADAARPVGAGIDVQREIQELLASAGAMPEDQRMRAMELETARTPLDALRRAQLAQGSAEMANRGILGMGPEAEYRERLESRLAPAYAQAGQELELAQRERENTRYLEAVRVGEAQSTQQAALQEQSISTAMQLATGMSEEQSRNLLNTVSTLNERQELQNNIALESLDRNIEWNKFLAEFGLQRDMVIELIQQKKFDQLLPLVQSYMNAVTSAAEGVVEPAGD